MDSGLKEVKIHLIRVICNLIETYIDPEHDLASG